jgi:TonB-dependent SusC/RagA subfamily outer membrane receptor
MLILDGVPIDLRFLSSINPNDIVDVTILKSASATAVYGPDGANGALIVTTKKGSRTRPSVSVSHTVQVERVSYMPELQMQFGSGSSVDALGYGIYDPIENQCYGDEFDGSLREIGRVAPDGSFYMVPYKALPNEKRRFFSTGLTNQTDLSFSTGDFYLSVQSVLIQGIIPKDVNRRMSVHAAGNKEYNRFKAAYSVNYTKGNYEVSDGANFGNGRDYDPIWNLVNTPANIPVSRFKNWRTDYWSSPDGYFNDYYSNPYFMIDNFRKKGKNEDIFGNLELNFKATNWLTFTYRLGATVSSQTYKSTQAALTYGDFAKASGKAIAQTGDFASGVLDVSNTQSRINSEFFASIRKKFGKFDLNVLLGQSFREDNSKNVNMSNTNLAFPALFNIIGRRGDPTIGESDFKSRLERFFGKVSLNFNSWLFLEGTGSYDIDSRLAYYYNYDFENTNYFYPGGSLSVLLSEAIPAIKSSKLISYLKLRGAYTKTGNVNIRTQGLENTYNLAFAFPFGSLSGYTSSNLLSLSKYKPEFVHNREAGIEIGLLKNRINIEATVYNQVNSNQIVDVAYSAATGFTQARLNAAEFENKGIELDLRLTPLVKIHNVSIDVKANYTYQDNKVTKIIEGVSQLGIGNGSYVIVGKPAYTFQVTDYVRDDQGRVIVNSTTGLPTVDPSIKPYGRTMPVHLLGLSVNVNWKDFSFSAVGDYRGGNQIYLGGVGNVTGLGPSMDFSGISKRSAQNSRQPFIFPNSSYFDGTKYVDNTNIYMTTSAYGFWSTAVNTSAGTNYLVSGAFWKIRESEPEL